MIKLFEPNRKSRLTYFLALLLLLYILQSLVVFLKAINLNLSIIFTYNKASITLLVFFKKILFLLHKTYILLIESKEKYFQNHF